MSFNPLLPLNKLGAERWLRESLELIKIHFHCFRWLGKFAGLMMIPARISDEILIAELPLPELSISSKITNVLRCREQLIGSVIHRHLLLMHLYNCSISLLFTFNNVNISCLHLTMPIFPRVVRLYFLKIFQSNLKSRFRNIHTFYVYIHLCHFNCKWNLKSCLWLTTR